MSSERKNMLLCGIFTSEWNRFTALAILPNFSNSFTITSLDMKGGTLETVALVAGAYSGVTGAKVSFNHIPLTVNSLTSVSDLKKHDYRFFHLWSRDYIFKTKFLTNNQEQILHCHPRTQEHTCSRFGVTGLAFLAHEQSPSRWLQTAHTIK